MSRTVLVTGASAGIGLAISRACLQRGFTVLGLGRTVSSAGIDDPRFIPYTVDLADLAALPRHLQTLARDYPAVDAVICNAGRGQFASLEEFSYEQIRALMDLNFTSQAYVARAFISNLKKQGRGDLVFIGSEAALSGGRRGAVYCASKFALRGLAQALREECARSNVRVCIVNPGMTATGFYDNLHFSPGPDAGNYVAAEDVAEAVLTVLTMRTGTVIDELTLTPQKKVIAFKNGQETAKKSLSDQQNQT